MTTVIVLVFILGYAMIALESVTKINKAAVALLMSVVVWGLFAMGGHAGDIDALNACIERNLGEAGTTLFFLMGAMIIIEVIDEHGGFDCVQRMIHARGKRSLLWKIGMATFLMSAVLDNMTTAIVMIMILRKLVAGREDRLWYAATIIIAANAGGAFSPIGDVTTLMLWNSNAITSEGIIRGIMVPSVFAFAVPALFIQTRLHGRLEAPETSSASNNNATPLQRGIVLVLGIGGLCSVPVFHSVTGLPAFVGVLLALGVLWLVTELLYWHKAENDSTARRVGRMVSRIDMATILFFLGILMSVAVLSETGVLAAAGQWLSTTIGNSSVVTGVIGILSAVVDNVPLVAGAMKMYAV
ncbi:MAG: sodium:proton antiporter NhaD [Clostridium sp.]|nr:sodium:proton antiporter NhaD [Clostridium sp.]